jgi:radical SAM superfamily enzyme YgiQ (UPF0313 family)
MRMRDPGAVLLVSCYELGHQPIGLASPLASLERAGYAPAACDLAVEPLDEDAVRRARFVGVSVPMHTALRMGMRVAARVRALNPRAHLCFYGLYAPLHRAALLDGRLADSIVGGEYEEALVERVRALEEAAAPPDPVDVPIRRTALERPARRALPLLSRYARLVRADGSEVLAGHTEASRGCLHRCRHCPIPALYDGRFFVVPEEVVLADVRQQVEAGARHITLGDPDFWNAPRHAMAIVGAIHREFPSLSFDVTVKIEHLLERAPLLPELGRLGCLFIVSAVESLSDRVLAILDKGHRRADVVRALGLCRAAGIALRPSLVPFTPWSTLDDYLELCDFLEEHALVGAVDPVQLTIRLLVPPGSLLIGHPEMAPHLGPLDGERLTHRWTHPDPRMDALQREAAALVAREQAGRDPAPPGETLLHLRALALAIAGRAAREPAPRPRFPTEGAPRLTESWFC